MTLRIQPPMPQEWQINEFEARQRIAASHDPLPDPEPIAPSLPGPDPGVFHHEPGQPIPTEEETDPA